MHDDQLIQSFTRIIYIFGQLERMPRDFGVGHLLYPSEVHVVDSIGKNPGIKLTDLAKTLGITKGAVPKIIRKLEAKGLVVRYQAEKNNKEVLFRLTDLGRKAGDGHTQFHKKFDRNIKQKLALLSTDQKAFLHVVFKELEAYGEELLR